MVLITFLLPFGIITLLAVGLSWFQTVWERQRGALTTVEESHLAPVLSNATPLLSRLTTDEKLQYLIELVQSTFADERVRAAANLTSRRTRFLSTLAWNAFAIVTGWLLSTLVNFPPLLSH